MVASICFTPVCSLLERGRSLGDALVVALNSDRWVRTLKGEGRPILDEQERAEVIAALALSTM